MRFAAAPAWIRMPLRIAALLVLAYVVLAGAIWVFGERLIFLPPLQRYARTPQILLLPRAGGGHVAAMHLRNPAARFTILYSHGNGEDLAADLPILERMRDTGFEVLAYDYSGYGQSTGRPSERAAYADVDAAYDYLTRTAGVPPARIIAHGRSLGGAMAADLASRRPVAGLVLESTFTSVKAVAGWLPPLPFDRFRTGDKLARIRVPLLVIHGTRDEVIGFAHGRALYERASSPKRFYEVPGAGHNDLLDVAGDAYWRELQAFAASLPAGASVDAGNPADPAASRDSSDLSR